MIVDHEHRFIFIHIEKTGGTSWEHALCEATGMDVRKARFDDSILPGRETKHMTARQLRGILGTEVWDRYFKFAVVRNPYDRLLSHWSYHAQLESHPDWLLEDWVAYPDFRAFLAGLARGEVHARPSIQSWMLCDDRGELLVDYVGRFERLAEDFDAVCGHLGLAARPLPRIAASRHAPWETYYDDVTRAAVCALDRVDFWRFDYPTGLVQHGPPRLGDAIVAEQVEAIRVHPDDVERIVWLARRYVDLGAYESAAILYHRAHDLVPRDAYLKRAHEALALRPRHRTPVT